MFSYIVKRLLAVLPILLGVVTAVFILMNVLPGDPTDVLLQSMGGGDVYIKGQLRKRLGLDRPLYVRYVDNLAELTRGDLGHSIVTNEKVANLVRTQFPGTLQLAIASIILATVAGILTGVLASVAANSWFDATLMSSASLLISAPSFLIGLVLIMIFSYWLKWVPVISTGLSAAALVLPTLALGLPAAAAIARVARSAMLDVLGAGYIATAKAKGLHRRAIYGKHALRNALVSTMNLVGVYFGYLVTGTVVVETVFARRGLGRMVIDGILQRDFPTVQAVILLGAVAFMLINLAVDVVCAWLDPRISYG